MESDGAKTTDPNAPRYLVYIALLFGVIAFAGWACEHYGLVLIAVQEGQNV